MSDPWFRMHANILDKPVVWRLASATGINPVKAAGHLAAFWGKVSQHGSKGNVGALPDAQLESWAGWDGKKGAFADWLRESHLTEGVVNEYDEYSGALEAHREKERERIKKWRTERVQNDDVTRTDTVTEHVQEPLRTRSVHSNDTIRNDTEVQEQKITAAPRRAPKPKSEPKYPHYPTDLCQRLFAKWDLEMAHVDYARFRKDTAIAFQTAEGATRDEAVLLETIDLFALLRDKASEKERVFYTPARWAADLDARLMRVAAMPMSVNGLPTEKARLVLEGLAA